jgi:hypothetical protein
MRIVQAGHFQFRKYGKAQVSTELKLFNGFVRLNHNVQIFSERDTAAFEAPFGWRDLGKKHAATLRRSLRINSKRPICSVRSAARKSVRR